MVGGGSGQGARDKSRTAKAKASLDAPSAALPVAQAVSVVPVSDDTAADAAVDAKSAPKYVIFLLLYFAKWREKK